MLELDHLLTRWLESGYPGSSGDEKSAFRELLELPDAELTAYILGNNSPTDKRLNYIVDQIRHGADS